MSDLDPKVRERARHLRGSLQPIEAGLLAEYIDKRVAASIPPVPELTDVGLLAPYIDHTVLKADTLPGQIEALCQEARQFGFASVCVNSCYVARCKELLAGAESKVCTVVGFPLGAMETASKAEETRRAVANGADEVDMVLAVGHLKGGEVQYVLEDIRAVVKAAGGKLVKVIFETCLLTPQERIDACLLSAVAGAHFVKTSTGFSNGGATVEDIRLMRNAVGPFLGVKASGGVRTSTDGFAMINAGATRLGASAGVAIVSGGAGAGAY